MQGETDLSFIRETADSALPSLLITNETFFTHILFVRFRQKKIINHKSKISLGFNGSHQ